MKKLVFLCLVLFSGIFFGQKKEVLKIEWPEEYKMKKSLDIGDEKTRFVVFVPENETMDNWTILGSLVSYKKTKVPNVDIIIKSYEETFLKEEPSAKLTILEKNNRVKNIWALFKIEAPSISKKSKFEAQLVYVIQGEDDIHNVFVMIKEKTLSQKFVKKWSKIFKEGKLINE
jgi:hypothetical protein